MPAEPYGAALIGPIPARLAGSGCSGWVGQVRRQVRPHRDRPDARTAAAVRDAERLVQVQVRDVAAELARLGEPEERVEVRPVDVHLAAGSCTTRAELGDAVLVDAVGRRVGHHDRGQVVAVLLALRGEVVEVDVAVLGAPTTTTRIPAITADAALVPCAEDGIRHTSRASSPLATW